MLLVKEDNKVHTDVDQERDQIKHIAIIMDGNGRWANERGLKRTAGHEEGAKTVRRVTTHANNLGIKYLTKKDINLMEECNTDTKETLTSVSDEIETDSIAKSKKRRQIRDLQFNKFLISKIPTLKYEKQILLMVRDSLQYIKVDSSLSNKILNEIQ